MWIGLAKNMSAGAFLHFYFCGLTGDYLRNKILIVNRFSEGRYFRPVSPQERRVAHSHQQCKVQVVHRTQ